ncbi:hypothetical protein C1645_834118 [Glomus cerebriforme]|uniref:GATA-type domain-containing protein n=1 Tax=Glomus cerebriforme TaxID=658196 RepID=A0A397SEC7_9GLOM|nr:hypothetical protein C1645_834118 [Glomus cerebriforme]
MEQNNPFQEYQSLLNQYSYQENSNENIPTNSYYTQNHENAFIDPKLLLLDFITYPVEQNYTPEHNNNDNNNNNNNMTVGLSETACAECLTTSAPSWRIRQDGKKVCDSCGLKSEPEKKPKVKRSKQPKICTNCGINKSACWRRVDGKRHCNACGLYAKINGRPRLYMLRGNKSQGWTVIT